MAISSVIQVALMSFVLLAPTVMVAVLVSGIARRGLEVEPEAVEV